MITPLPDDIRNRIIEVRPLRFGDIANHPLNPKIHGDRQREALRGSVRELGFATVPIAYHSERNDGALTWADGHLRGEEVSDFTGSVAIVDFTDAEADLFVATADPIAAMAATSRAQLDALLREINTGEPALQALLAEMAEEAGLAFSGNGTAVEPPEDFSEYGDDIPIEHVCPKCGYKWSGAAG